MCDEYEQKSERLKVLEEKVEELRKTQGRFNLSGKCPNRTYMVVEFSSPSLPPSLPPFRSQKDRESLRLSAGEGLSDILPPCSGVAQFSRLSEGGTVGVQSETGSALGHV